MLRESKEKSCTFESQSLGPARPFISSSTYVICHLMFSFCLYDF